MTDPGAIAAEVAEALEAMAEAAEAGVDNSAPEGDGLGAEFYGDATGG